MSLEKCAPVTKCVLLLQKGYSYRGIINRIWKIIRTKKNTLSERKQSKRQHKLQRKYYKKKKNLTLLSVDDKSEIRGQVFLHMYNNFEKICKIMKNLSAITKQKYE